MSFNRSILLKFQIYEQARATFPKSIADLAQRSENIMVLNSAGVMPLPLSNQNRFYKKSSCYVLRAVAKHNAQLAEDIVRYGALPPLIHNLNDLDYQVKEAATWALGYIAKHNSDLAGQVVEEGLLKI